MNLLLLQFYKLPHPKIHAKFVIAGQFLPFLQTRNVYRIGQWSHRLRVCLVDRLCRASISILVFFLFTYVRLCDLTPIHVTCIESSDIWSYCRSWRGQDVELDVYDLGKIVFCEPKIGFGNYRRPHNTNTMFAVPVYTPISLYYGYCRKIKLSKSLLFACWVINETPGDMFFRFDSELSIE